MYVIRTASPCDFDPSAICRPGLTLGYSKIRLDSESARVFFAVPNRYSRYSCRTVCRRHCNLNIAAPVRY
jgi:hypothetical protein